MGYLDIKYEPVELDDFVFAKTEVKAKIIKLIERGFSSPIIIHGHFGVGKLSVANYVAKSILHKHSASEVLSIKDDVGLGSKELLDFSKVLLVSQISGICEVSYWSKAKSGFIDKYKATGYLPQHGDFIKPIISDKKLSAILVLHRGDFLTQRQKSILSDAPSILKKWNIPLSRLQVIITTTELASLPISLVESSQLLHLATPSSKQWLSMVKKIINTERFSGATDKQLLQLIRLCKGNGRHILYALEAAMWD